MSPPSKETVAFSVLNGRMCRFLSGHGETNRAFFPCQGVSQKITRKVRERKENDYLFLYLMPFRVFVIPEATGGGKGARFQVSPNLANL